MHGRTYAERAEAEQAAPEQKAPERESEGAAAKVLGLQRQAGNRSVVALLGAQAVLEVGHVDDPLEREADAAARRVVQKLRAGVTPDGAEAGGPVARSIRRRPEPARRSIGPEGGEVDPEVERALAAERSNSGKPLAEGARRRMEKAFGADFGDVRVHEGARSTELNEAFGAKAFTVGNDIFFRGAVPDTRSAEGQHLLAHELAHTVQQGESPVARTVRREGEETSEGHETAEEETTEGVEMSGGGTGSGEVMENSTAPPAGETADASPARSSKQPRAQRQAQPDRPSGPGRQVRLNVAAVSFTTSTERSAKADRSAAQADTKAKLSVAQRTSGGASVTPFGANTAGTSRGDYSWKYKKGTMSVTADIDFTCDWGVNGGTNTDIKSASDAAITADNFEAVATDLTPVQDLKSWVAPRRQYWSSALTSRHEKYHAADAQGWVKKQGKAFMTNDLNARTIAVDDADDADAIDAKVDDAVEKSHDAFWDAYNEYMDGKPEAAYYAKPCEERAFGDGKEPYMKLAAGIREHGAKLAARKKKADEKAAKKLPETPKKK